MRNVYLFLCSALPWLSFAQTDFYDSNTVQDVYLEFAQSNWDYLLDSLHTAGDDRLVATSITINGQTLYDVGVKYKGNSSYQPNNTKNPFNIKLDHLIPGQNYQGYESFKFSNAFKDPSFTREALGYEIARYYMPAPKANFIRLYVNGNYHGVFTNVESVNGEFLDEHFANNDGVMFKCDPTQGMPQPGGCIPGGATLEYLGTDTACYYPKYELESAYGWAQLRSLTNVLKNSTNNVDQLLDVDRALWMCAFNNVLVNFDSYLGSGHNYYVYQDNNQRFNTILWDCNEVFGVFANGGSGPALNLSQMQNLSSLHNQTMASRPLLNKLLNNPKHKKSYIAHLRTIVEENFANGSYLTRAQAMQVLIDAAVQTDANKFYSYNDFLNNTTTTASGILGISELMSSRSNYLQNTDAETVKVPPTISAVAPSNNSPAINDMVFITATVSGGTMVKLRFRPGRYDVFQEMDMLDDGNNGDGAAGDGVFGAAIQVPAGGLQYYIYSENADAAMFSPVRAEYEFYQLTASSANPIAMGDLVINEFMASNATIVADQDTQYNDWIELYNNTGNSISLNGVYLSDNISNPTKWAFPDTTIAANGFLIIWADNDTFQTGLHAYFKLSATGEELGLFNSDGTVIDTLTFGAQTTDISYGRYPNGTGSFTVMPPTFSAVNSLTTAAAAPESVFSYAHIFPNPVQQGQANLVVLLQETSEVNIQIFDNLGRSIYNTTTEMAAGDNLFAIPCGHWAMGMYYVRLSTAKGQAMGLKIEVN